MNSHKRLTLTACLLAIFSMHKIQAQNIYPPVGNVGIGTLVPNQLLTVRGGNINLSSPIGNTAYMLTSNAFPADRVLWHNGNRQNIFVGVLAGNAGNAAGGTRSTFVGYRAGFSATNTLDCVFMGSNSGFSNTTGSWNVFVGSGTGIFNNADRNVFIGYQSGNSNTTGSSCVFVGYHAGRSNVGANANTFLGHQAGKGNITGYANTFVGNNSAMQCVGGYSNVSVGANSGFELVSGIENVFAGASCAANNQTGSQNVVIGNSAAQLTASIDQNVIIGEEAYTAPAVIGDANVIVGWRASNLMQVGRDNVMIGHRVNSLTPALDDNIYIGHQSGSTVGGLTNSIAIGSNAYVENDNHMILGDNSVNVGIGLSTDVAGPQNKLEINTGNLNSQPNLAASGLRFRDLTAASPTTANPGAGVLAVNSQGDVIYVPSGGGAGLGTCAAPSTFGGANGAIDLTNTDNFYFIGNGAGTALNNVVIGKNCTAPVAKLDVLQSSGSAVGSIGIYQENTDLAGTVVGEEVIGIKSFIPFTSNPNSVGQIAIQGIAMGDKFNIAVDGFSTSSGSNVFCVGGRFTAIGTSSVVNDGVSAYAQDAFNNTGVRGVAVNGDNSIGVAGTGSGATIRNYGMEGQAFGGQDAIGGIFFASGGTNTNYALYSNGDLFINGVGTGSAGVFYASDVMFKTNIDSISDASDILVQLQPKQFYFDTTNVYGMRFSDNKQYGLIAQDVEAVLPELVEIKTKPAEYDSAGNVVVPSVSYKTLNYNAFIAILIQGMQEQQSQIDSLQTQINSCCSAVSRISSNTNQQDVTLADTRSIVLNQNVPNPFAEQTTISFLLPESVVKAQMLFYDAQGKLIKAVDLDGRGAGQLNVFADDLSNGIYSYALIADGQVIDTKQMVKTK